MAEHGKRSDRQRHWTDTLFAVAALFVSAISLWIGIRTEQANEQLVAASTWPYLFVESSNANPDGTKIIHMDVTNSGVGPAKVESFEVFWNGKPWPSADLLMRACCGYKPFNAAADIASKRTMMLEGGVQGTVIRAGETRNFVTLPLGPDDGDVWHALNDARLKMSYRICYCSVFDECWVGSFGGIKPLADQLHPTRVKTCPMPAVPFLQ
jgi:hypothetical protein